MAWQLPIQQASLFGKLPTVLDYVRVNHSYPAAIALDEWLSRSLQDLTVASLSWPAARYRFVFAPSGSEHAVVGVFGPSRDRAGRKFPLSIFVPVPISAVLHKFAALPLACAPLFEAADALLDQAATLSRDDLAAQLENLPRLDGQALDEAHETLQVALDERSAEQFTRDLYAGVDYQAEDAFARATGALSKARAAAPERALTLDCPLASPDDVGAWLSLPEACLGWSDAVPSLFWSTRSDPGRLLISLGAPLPSLPVRLADRKRKSERLVSLYALNQPPPAMTSGWDAATASLPAPPTEVAPIATSSPTPVPPPVEPSSEPALAVSVAGAEFEEAAPVAELVESPEPVESAEPVESDESAREAVASPRQHEAEIAREESAPRAAPVPLPIPAPRGPSLWRKLRALAVSV